MGLGFSMCTSPCLCSCQPLSLPLCSTVVGLKVKDGVVLVSIVMSSLPLMHCAGSAGAGLDARNPGPCAQGVEKLIVSKLLVENSNRRIFNVERHAGAVRTEHRGGQQRQGLASDLGFNPGFPYCDVLSCRRLPGYCQTAA